MASRGVKRKMYDGARLYMAMQASPPNPILPISRTAAGSAALGAAPARKLARRQTQSIIASAEGDHEDALAALRSDVAELRMSVDADAAEASDDERPLLEVLGRGAQEDPVSDQVPGMESGSASAPLSLRARLQQRQGAAVRTSAPTDFQSALDIEEFPSIRLPEVGMSKPAFNSPARPATPEVAASPQVAAMSDSGEDEPSLDDNLALHRVVTTQRFAVKRRPLVSEELEQSLGDGSSEASAALAGLSLRQRLQKRQCDNGEPAIRDPSPSIAEVMAARFKKTSRRSSASSVDGPNSVATPCRRVGRLQSSCSSSPERVGSSAPHEASAANVSFRVPRDRVAAALGLAGMTRTERRGSITPQSKAESAHSEQSNRRTSVASSAAFVALAASGNITRTRGDPQATARLVPPSSRLKLPASPKRHTRQTAATKASGFKVGDLVQMREHDLADYMEGTVTCVFPLQVDGCSWDEVRPVQKAAPVRQRELYRSSSNLSTDSLKSAAQTGDVGRFESGTSSSSGNSYSARELKAMMTERGIDFANCVEKSDLQVLWDRFHALRSRPLLELRTTCGVMGNMLLAKRGGADDCAIFLLSSQRIDKKSEPSAPSTTPAPAAAKQATATMPTPTPSVSRPSSAPARVAAPPTMTAYAAAFMASATPASASALARTASARKSAASRPAATAPSARPSPAAPPQLASAATSKPAALIDTSATSKPAAPCNPPASSAPASKPASARASAKLPSKTAAVGGGPPIKRAAVSSARGAAANTPAAAAAPAAPALAAPAAAPVAAAGADREQTATDEVSRILPLRREAYSSLAAWGFAVLQVSPSADKSAVSSAYRNLMKRLHPDRVGHLPAVTQAIEAARQAREVCERALSQVEVPSAPLQLTCRTLCVTPGQRRVQLDWKPPRDVRGTAPIRRYLVAAVDPAYGRALTVATLEPDYREELGRYVSVEEIRSHTLAEQSLQKMPGLFRQNVASFQVACANEAGQSPWSTIRVSLAEPSIHLPGTTSQAASAAAPRRARCSVAGPGLGAAAASSSSSLGGGVGEIGGAKDKQPAGGGGGGAPAAVAMTGPEFEMQLQARRGAPGLRQWLGRTNKVLLINWLKSRSWPATGSKEELVERVEFAISGSSGKEKQGESNATTATSAAARVAPSAAGSSGLGVFGSAAGSVGYNVSATRKRRLSTAPRC